MAHPRGRIRSPPCARRSACCAKGLDPSGRSSLPILIFRPMTLAVCSLSLITRPRVTRGATPTSSPPQSDARSFAPFSLAYVDLGWSSYAAQWLSRAPAPFPDHIFARSATGDARDAFARQARLDWEAFLSLRANELRPGGRLVVVMPSLDTVGRHPSAVLFESANLVLADMVAQGAVTASECERMLILSYPRTPDEMLAPFASGGQFADLKVTHCAAAPIGDVAWARYEQDRDAVALAARRAAFFRATFAPSLASALERRGDAQPRSAFERSARSRLTPAAHGPLRPLRQFRGVVVA